jgi:hypothetical protein
VNRVHVYTESKQLDRGKVRIKGYLGEFKLLIQNSNFSQPNLSRQDGNSMDMGFGLVRSTS